MNQDDLTGSDVGRGTNGASTSDGKAFQSIKGAGQEAPQGSSGPESWSLSSENRGTNGASIVHGMDGNVKGSDDMSRTAWNGMDPSVKFSIGADGNGDMQ